MTTEELENYIPKGEEFDLENYIPKGDLEGFPKEIIARMLECQEKQGNPRDISVFEKLIDAGQCIEGFDWNKTQEDCDFWREVIRHKDFNLFFEKYPKQDNQNSAKEFIILHTKFDLENYEPKGDLIDFPKEIIARMLEYQVEQGNPRDISVFEKRVIAGDFNKGFIWNKTKEGNIFWNDVINNKDFDIFFERYPKQDNQNNSQEFRVGDNVIDIILNLKGEIINVKSNGNLQIQFEGESSITEYNLKIEKRPSLLHYRDDYDYDVIDFNNLPKRQEAKRWRAEKGGIYYCIIFGRWSFATEIRDIYGYDNNANYNSGNYFRTEEEAQEVADKLHKYFQELINPNK